MAVKNKVQLITYPDSLGGDLKTLDNVLTKYFPNTFKGGIHILPPFPSSGDRGFAPLTYLGLPNGIILFNQAEYLETTGYYQLSPGIYNFEILLGASESPTKYIKNITLDGCKFYTIYIIGLFNDKPPLGYLFVDDAI